MTRLPESGQLGTNTVRDHFGGSGETSFSDDYYRGQLVPDVQQFVGSGVSNDTGSVDQQLRLFMHNGFMSNEAGTSYTINFDVDETVFTTVINNAFAANENVAGAIAQLQDDIEAAYPSFRFSEVTTHTAQASSVEINCQPAETVSSGESRIYLHGNFMNDAAGFVILDIPASTGGVELATLITNTLNGNDDEGVPILRSLFNAEQSGSEVILRSTGRVHFWISESGTQDNFVFSSSVWVRRPFIREFTPIEEIGRYNTGDPPIDIGSDAGLSVNIDTEQNLNPTNSVRWQANDSVEYWIELTTIAEGSAHPGSTDAVIRVAIADSWNAGAGLGEYPDYFPNSVEISGFDEDPTTHSAGNRFSFPIGGEIASQSTSGAWTFTPNIGTTSVGGSDPAPVDGLLQNRTGGDIDLRNFRLDASISLAPGGTTTTTPNLIIRYDGMNNRNVFNATSSITEAGEFIFSQQAFEGVNSRTDTPGTILADDGLLQIYIDENTNDLQGFQYIINYIRLSSDPVVEYKPAGIYPTGAGDSVAITQFDTSRTLTSSTADIASFSPGGVIDSDIGNWQVFPEDDSNPVMRLRRFSGGDIDLSSYSIRVGFEVLSKPDGATIIVGFETDIGNTGAVGGVLWSGTISVGSVGEYEIPISTVDPDNSGTILPEGDDLGIYLFVDDAAHRTGFQYRINFVRISNSALDFSPSGEEAAFTFDIDETDLAFAGDLTGGFVADDDATASLNQFADLVQVMWPTVTHGAVTDYTIDFAVGEYTRELMQRDTSGAFNLANQWDLREGESRQSASFAFTAWGDFVNRWFHFDVGTTRFSPEGATGTIVIEASDDATNFAEFTWNLIHDHTFGNDIRSQAISIHSIGLFAGDPSAITSIDIVMNDDGVALPAKQIQLDTHQTNELDENFVLRRGNSTGGVVETTEFLRGVDAPPSDMSSSYTIMDPDGAEVASLTARSQESSTQVIERLSDAVNDHTFTTTNGFITDHSGNTLWLRPDSRRLESNDWTVLVDHGAGNDGTAAFAHSRPNDSVPTSGEMNFPDDIYNTENGEAE